MEFEPGLVGAKLRPFETEVTWRQTTNYAAAVGHREPCYFDDRRPDGLVAPPMLAVALTWPVSSNLGDFLEPREATGGDLPDRVHYSETLEFHRLVRPGDRLTIQGRVAAVLPHKAGTHFILCYEARDEQGEPVFTEYSGALLLGKVCPGQGAGVGLPEAPAGEYGGRPVWTAKLPIDPALPYLYDGCTDIVYAIHTSPAFAAMVGLPGIILQGTCTLALAVRELLDREAGGDPARLKALGCRFTGMAPPGTDIRVELKGRDQDGSALFFEVWNSAGQRAVSKGYLLLAE
jgi:acyl dehydratase